MRTTSIVVLCSAAILLTSCTHVMPLRGFDADPANLQNSKDKGIAVVMLEPQFKDRYERSVGGHTFIFEGLRGWFKRTFSSALRDSVRSVEFYTNDPPGDFDVYLYPELKIDLSSAFIFYKCNVEYALAVKDKNKREITKKSTRTAHTFSSMNTADNACQIALIQAFGGEDYSGGITYEVFHLLEKQ